MTNEEIKVARERMELYLFYAENTKKKDFYNGAAAAINDLLCRLGAGDAVADLTEKAWDQG